jgi:hypothetical protein
MRCYTPVEIVRPQQLVPIEHHIRHGVDTTEEKNNLFLASERSSFCCRECGAERPDVVSHPAAFLLTKSAMSAQERWPYEGGSLGDTGRQVDGAAAGREQGSAGRTPNAACQLMRSGHMV